MAGGDYYALVLLSTCGMILMAAANDLIVIFLALMLISWFSPLMQKMGFGKLPGDFRFRLFGREWFIPLTTTIIFSLLAGVISKLL